MNIKLLLKRHLPQRMVHRIRQIRYARSMKRVNENSELELKMIKELIRDGDSVIDIGANLGFYTKYMSDRVGPQGRVYSIEPVPSTFEILQYVTRSLDLENVDVFNCAISSHDGWAIMQVPRDGSGEQNIFEAHIVNPGLEASPDGIRVETRSLDSLLGQTGTIAFIKCDVEGHEMDCLRGATLILKKSKPRCMIEVWGLPDDPSCAGHETFKFMRAQGYREYVFDGTHLKLRKQGEVSPTGNYFFLMDNHVEQIRGKNIALVDNL